MIGRAKVIHLNEKTLLYIAVESKSFNKVINFLINAIDARLPLRRFNYLYWFMYFISRSKISGRDHLTGLDTPYNFRVQTHIHKMEELK